MQTCKHHRKNLMGGGCPGYFRKKNPTEQPPEPPAADPPEVPQAESEKQSHSKRPYVPNPADYLNTRDILRQVAREKELEKARKQAEEQSPPPPDRR